MDFLGGEGFAAGESGLVHVHEKTEPGLQWCAVGREVVAVERVTHFEAEGIAGAQTAGDGAMSGEFIPPVRRFFRFAEELEAILAGIAGAADDAGAAAEGDEFGDAIPVGKLHVGSRDLLIDCGGRRALDGHARVTRAFVGQGDAGEEAGLHPGEVLGGFGGIDHQEPCFGSGAVKNEVINHPAAFVEEERVLPLPDPETGVVVGEEAVQPVAGGGALDAELSHVRDVEDAAGTADREVFLGDALVLHRHIPAGKGHHPGSGVQVGFMQRGERNRGSIVHR